MALCVYVSSYVNRFFCVRTRANVAKWNTLRCMQFSLMSKCNFHFHAQTQQTYQNAALMTAGVAAGVSKAVVIQKEYESECLKNIKRFSQKENISVR